jgi:hypothetical protein
VSAVTSLRLHSRQVHAGRRDWHCVAGRARLAICLTDLIRKSCGRDPGSLAHGLSPHLRDAARSTRGWRPAGHRKCGISFRMGRTCSKLGAKEACRRKVYGFCDVTPWNVVRLLPTFRLNLPPTSSGLLFCSEDGANMLLLTFGNYLPDYTASHPRRPL